MAQGLHDTGHVPFLGPGFPGIVEDAPKSVMNGIGTALGLDELGSHSLSRDDVHQRGVPDGDKAANDGCREGIGPVGDDVGDTQGCQLQRHRSRYSDSCIGARHHLKAFGTRPFHDLHGTGPRPRTMADVVGDMSDGRNHHPGIRNIAGQALCHLAEDWQVTSDFRPAATGKKDDAGFLALCAGRAFVVSVSQGVTNIDCIDTGPFPAG